VRIKPAGRGSHGVGRDPRRAGRAQDCHVGLDARDELLRERAQVGPRRAGGIVALLPGRGRLGIIAGWSKRFGKPPSRKCLQATSI
jgi:hypothetical protein